MCRRFSYKYLLGESDQSLVVDYEASFSVIPIHPIYYAKASHSDFNKLRSLALIVRPGNHPDATDHQYYLPPTFFSTFQNSLSHLETLIYRDSERRQLYGNFASLLSAESLFCHIREGKLPALKTLILSRYHERLRARVNQYNPLLNGKLPYVEGMNCMLCPGRRSIANAESLRYHMDAWKPHEVSFIARVL